MIKNNKNQHIKSAIIRLNEYDIHPDYNKSFYSSKFSGLEEKNRCLNKLKNGEDQKNKEKQREEPKNILEMDVISRGKYWSENKAKNLKRIEGEMSQRSMEGCTFSPELSPRMNISMSTLRPKSVNTSYSQIFQYKKMNQNLSPSKNTIKNNHNNDKPKEKSPGSEKYVLTYKQLSPYSKKIAYKAGLNLKKFISNARPMIRYKSARIFWSN